MRPLLTRSVSWNARRGNGALVHISCRPQSSLAMPRPTTGTARTGSRSCCFMTCFSTWSHHRLRDYIARLRCATLPGPKQRWPRSIESPTNWGSTTCITLHARSCFGHWAIRMERAPRRSTCARTHREPGGERPVAPTNLRGAGLTRGSARHSRSAERRWGILPSKIRGSDGEWARSSACDPCRRWTWQPPHAVRTCDQGTFRQDGLHRGSNRRAHLPPASAYRQRLRWHSTRRRSTNPSHNEQPAPLPPGRRR